jgi:hypothetical protein
MLSFAVRLAPKKLLASGLGIRKVGRLLGLGTSTVQKLANEMRGQSSQMAAAA